MEPKRHFIMSLMEGQPYRKSGDRLAESLGLEVMTPIEVRQSMVSDYAVCPRYFLWRHRFGLVGKGHKAAPFIGHLFHLAMGAYYKGLTPIQVEQAVEGYLTEYLQSLLKDCSQDGPLPSDLAETAASVRRDAMKAAAMADVFQKLHPFDATSYEIVAVEKELTVDLGAPWGRIAGRLDLLLRHTSEPKGLLVVDHKTTSRDLTTFLASRSYSTQLRMYRLLAEAYSAQNLGEPVIGMVYNLIQRPTIQIKAWQSQEEYRQELIDWYTGGVDTASPETYKTGPKKGQPKPRWDHSANLEKWAATGSPTRQVVCWYTEDNMPADFSLKLLTVGRACRADAVLESFPTFGVDNNHCVDLYGRSCPYLPLCSSTPEFYPSIIARMYEQREAADDSADADDYLT